MQAHRHGENSCRTDGFFQRNKLFADDDLQLLFDGFCDVLCSDRAVELSAFARGAHQNDFFSVELLLHGFSFGFLGLVFRGDLCVFFLRTLAAFFGGENRFALRQQPVSRVASFDGDLATRGAELVDAFEQDDLHEGRVL